MTGPIRDQSLRARVDRLEAELAAAIRQLRTQGDRAARWVWPRQVRLAKTTHDAEAYPAAPANCYEIEFVDATYTEAKGSQTPTYTARGKTGYALSLAGEYFPEGAYVDVVRIGRQWWILGAGTGMATAIDFALSAALAVTDSSKSATVDAYYDGSSPGASVTVYNKTASSNYVFAGASGAKGMALYDRRRGNYRIWNMECP